DLLADSGAYAYLSALVLMYAAVTAAGPYRVPHVSVDARVAFTNNPPTSAMRGFGAMQMVLGYESQMDQLARRLGIDPAELRARNALGKGIASPSGRNWTRTWPSLNPRGGSGRPSAPAAAPHPPRTAWGAAWPATSSPTAASRGSTTGRAPGSGSRWTGAWSSARAPRTSAGARRRRSARSPPKCWASTPP